MAEFQKELKTSIPAASPTSNINAQFFAFRSFVINSLESLHLQLQILSRQQDEMEVRSRRKMLLLHGVPEAHKEHTAMSVCKILSQQLKMPEISMDAINRCHRMDKKLTDKPRPILLKLKDVSLRNKIWFAKSCFKGSGVTLSEFLLKSRHEAFMAARKRFGVSRCWSKDGCVIVLGPNGDQHRIVSLSEVNNIAVSVPEASMPSTVAVTAVVSKDSKLASVKSKRAAKK